jgi:hypothetical protein
VGSLGRHLSNSGDSHYLVENERYFLQGRSGLKLRIRLVSCVVQENMLRGDNVFRRALRKAHLPRAKYSHEIVLFN